MHLGVRLPPQSLESLAEPLAEHGVSLEASQLARIPPPRGICKALNHNNETHLNPTEILRSIPTLRLFGRDCVSRSGLSVSLLCSILNSARCALFFKTSSLKSTKGAASEDTIAGVCDMAGVSEGPVSPVCGATPM